MTIPPPQAENKRFFGFCLGLVCSQTRHIGTKMMQQKVRGESVRSKVDKTKLSRPQIFC